MSTTVSDTLTTACPSPSLTRSSPLRVPAFVSSSTSVLRESSTATKLTPKLAQTLSASSAPRKRTALLSRLITVSWATRRIKRSKARPATGRVQS
eukprot:scaffold975_cov63-Phaeocystis_antarctica.AAC.9